jgi:archaellum component FlaC
MSDKNIPDDEQFEPSLNEDFDFGEEEPPTRPARKTASPIILKGFTWAIVVVIFSIIVGMGYRIFGSSHPNTLSKEASVHPAHIEAHLETPHPSTLPHTMHAPVLPPMVKEPALNDVNNAFSTPSATPPHAPQVPPQPVLPVVHAPIHEPLPTSTPAPTSTPTPVPAPIAPLTPMPMMPPPTPPSMPEPPPTQPAAPEPAASLPVKTETIQDLQRELFSPENIEAPKTMIVADVPTQHQVTELTTGLNKLNHQIDYILNQIKYLDSYTREVSENLNKLNDSINTMDHRLSTISNTTSNLSQDVGNVRSEVGNVRSEMGTVRSEVGHVKQVLREDGLDMNLSAIATPAQSKKKQTIPVEGTITLEEPEYVVHAVIPGRAWLKSSKGQIITVTEGETLGNYGKILVIDAANGVVLTSSGIAFR